MIIFLRSFGVKTFCFILCSPKLSKLSNFLNTVVEIVVVFSMLPCYIFCLVCFSSWFPCERILIEYHPENSNPFTDYFSEKAQVVPDELRTAYLLMSPNITYVQFKDLPGNEEMFSHSS